MLAQRIAWPIQGKVVVESFELPTPKADEILIEMDCTVISPGTEIAWLLAKPNTSGIFPQYPGYSGSGRILMLGAEVKNLQEGDRVIVDHCGHASHVVVRQDGWLGQGIHKIEDASISSEDASFVIIATMSLQGVRKARIELGESIAVTGLGLLGLFAVQFSRLSGGLPVIAIDPCQARRALALQLGAEYAFSSDDADLKKTCNRLTSEKGPDVIVESSGADVAVQQSLDLAAYRGRIVLLGCTRGRNADLNLYEYVHKKGASIIGAHNYVRPLHESSSGYWTTREDLQVILDLMSAQRLIIAPMISDIITPDAALDVYRRLQKPSHGLTGVVIDWR